MMYLLLLANSSSHSQDNNISGPSNNDCDIWNIVNPITIEEEVFGGLGIDIELLLLFYFIFVLEHKMSTGLVSCVTALYLFSKIHPSFLVPHAKTLLPYLSSKCSVCFIYELLTIITLISLSLSLVPFRQKRIYH